MLKRIIAATLAAAAALTLSGCSLFATQTVNALASYDFKNMKLVQLEEPAEGQDVVVIETSEGTVTAVLYNEYAPETVKNFKNRIAEGFYDNKPVFAVETKVYGITGASNDEGTEGVTDNGKYIENECTANLWPFKGALLGYSGEQGFSDSRFFMCGAIEITNSNVDELKGYRDEQTDEQIIPDELIEAFRTRGSVPGFAGLYTVFGQIINGYETLDKILSVKTGSNNKPEKEIMIKSIRLESYEKGKYVLEEPTADIYLTAEELEALTSSSESSESSESSVSGEASK